MTTGATNDARPLPLLSASSLERAGFRHGFSTRRGGVSAPPYDTLDFALARDPEALRENQRRLSFALGVVPEVLHQVNQVHGDVVLEADGTPSALVQREADALIAKGGSGWAVLVRVADCVPVLLADPVSGSVAAVHAGWKGLVLGVIRQTVRRMNGGPLLAAVGPCIGACCFEVGEDVAAKIGSDAVDRPSSPGKMFVDLRRAVRRELLAVGVAEVEDVAGCTRCDRERFHSFRRDGDASGRLVGAIVARS